MVDVELKELLDDANEVRQFIDRSNRSAVKTKLIEYVKDIEAQIARKRASKPSDETSAVVAKRIYEIKNYAWDQSDKFVKIYLTLNGVEAVPLSDVKSTFTDRSLVISVMNLGGNSHEFAMKNLLHAIDPQESSLKLKKDTVLVMLRKKDAKNWACLTQTEQQLKEKQDNRWKGKPEEQQADPGDGLMNVMKQMYETGDDEMKRTIAKAWTESREKQTKGEF